MPDRYFVEEPIERGRAVLTGPEAHHLAHVMRARPGQEVLLFDGHGLELVARVQRIGRSDVELVVMSSMQVDRELPVRITLGVAMPKGDRQRWIVEKATELGMARLVPLVTERGVALVSAGAYERLRRSVIEASKQCGRTQLMEISQPQTIAEFCRAQDTAGIMAHPGGQPLRDVIDKLREEKSGQIAFAVGPEGGLTDEEVAVAASAGWTAVDLGQRILRVETAAVLLAAAGAFVAESGRSTGS